MGSMAQGPLAGGNRPEETVETLGPDTNEPLAEAGAGSRPSRARSPGGMGRDVGTPATAVIACSSRHWLKASSTRPRARHG